MEKLALAMKETEYFRWEEKFMFYHHHPGKNWLQNVSVAKKEIFFSFLLKDHFEGKKVEQ
jgi:hypothetical protein